MPRAKEPNRIRKNVEQVVLVKGDIDSPLAFVEALNRKLAEGYTPLSIVDGPHSLMGFVSKKQRVDLGENV